jgi:hypothetical protein
MAAIAVSTEEPSVNWLVVSGVVVLMLLLAAVVACWPIVVLILGLYALRHSSGVDDNYFGIGTVIVGLLTVFQVTALLHDPHALPKLVVVALLLPYMLGVGAMTAYLVWFWQAIKTL